VLRPNIRAQAQSSASSDRPVLVTGAPDTTALKLIDELLGRSIPTRALLPSMDTPEAKQLLGRNEPLLQVVQGNACHYDSLVQAMNGCRACVSCASEPRPTQILDMLYKIWDPTLAMLGAWGPSQPPGEDYDLEDMTWLDPASTVRHPYNWAYLGACNLRDAAVETGCPHVLRLSEACVGASAWDPRTMARNARLSMQIKWQERADSILRESVRWGVRYTVIRAPAIVEEVPSSEAQFCIEDDQGSGAVSTGGWDQLMASSHVASLMAVCAAEGGALDSTLYCSYSPGGSGASTSASSSCASSWGTALATAGLTAAGPLPDLPGRDPAEEGGGEGGEGAGREAMPMYTSAVLSVPVLAAAAAYAVAVAEGVVVFPPREAQLFAFASVLPGTGLAFYTANAIRGAVMDKRPARPVLPWFKE
jgi:hypothetical protein